MGISLAASLFLGALPIDTPDDYIAALEVLALNRAVGALYLALRRKTADTALRPES